MEHSVQAISSRWCLGSLCSQFISNHDYHLIDLTVRLFLSLLRKIFNVWSCNVKECHQIQIHIFPFFWPGTLVPKVSEQFCTSITHCRCNITYVIIIIGLGKAFWPFSKLLFDLKSPCVHWLYQLFVCATKWHTVLYYSTYNKHSITIGLFFPFVIEYHNLTVMFFENIVQTLFQGPLVLSGVGPPKLCVEHVGTAPLAAKLSHSGLFSRDNSLSYLWRPYSGGAYMFGKYYQNEQKTCMLWQLVVDIYWY